MDTVEEYKMNHKRRGLALIFNHETFEAMRLSRRGTNFDRDALKQRFEALNFEVSPYNNLTKEGVMDRLKKASESSHEDADCFICVFLSHGENNYIYAMDEKIFIQDIMAFFKGDKCKSLVGKPKIFIFQSCRGDQPDNPVTPMCEDDGDDDTLGGNAKDMDVDGYMFCTLPSGADFLICYSVAEGYSSFRDPENGSWYIQELCKTLQHYGNTLEFTELLTLVNKKVCMRSVDNSSLAKYCGKKQPPCFVSMLTKKLYFRAKN